MSSVFKTTKIIAAVVCLLATASGARAQATARQPGTAPAVRYPIVFKQAEQVRALGLSVESGDRALKNKCYAYGEGSYRLSVSDERLAAAKAKGFSLESLCMGLVSEARFNPETGKRLPTYIYFDATGLRAELSTIRDDDPPAIRKYKGRDPATFSAKELAECCEQLPGFIWEELPLALCLFQEWHPLLGLHVALRPEVRQALVQCVREEVPRPRPVDRCGPAARDRGQTRMF